MRKTFGSFGLQVLDIREQDAVRSIESERYRFSKHLEHSPLGTKDIASIRPKDIADFARTLALKEADDYRGTRKLSRATGDKVMQLTRAIFDHAVEQGLRDDNPCLAVRRVRRVEAPKEKRTFLTLREQEAIENSTSISPYVKAMLMVAYGSGIRQGEQWNLQRRDVFLGGDEPYMIIRYGSKGLPPKNGKVRRVPLFGAALRGFQMMFWLRHALPGDLVFGSAPRTPRPVGAPHEFESWLALAGITRHVRWHDLRHTCGTALVSGMWGHRWDLIDIRDLLGHSSVKVTEMYADEGDTGVKRAAAMMRGM
jgi:integrase